MPRLPCREAREFPQAETRGGLTDLRPVRGASRNVRVSERVARGRNVRAGERVEDIGKRTRYYQSMIDIDSLLKGAVYSELKESYVIFICTSDPFESGLPVYTFERKPMNFRVAKTHGGQTDSRPVRSTRS